MRQSKPVYLFPLALSDVHEKFMYEKESKDQGRYDCCKSEEGVIWVWGLGVDKTMGLEEEVPMDPRS
uniref:Uncharacterized protein n=1 Tax=Vespula pensylvanica TaxID=30213 RepID=A0A834KU34_VESPE|nr:hypothetical protein H0235_012897 [Vespula pensylvanica]